MMIMWQFENAFQNLGEYFENPRFFLVFRGNRVGSVISHRQESLCVCVCVGRGGGLKKPALEDICNSVVFLAFLLADKATRQVGVIRNITLLWGIMLLLSRHNQNPP